MSKITFSISDLFQQAWIKFKTQPIFWVLITVLSIVVGAVGDYGLDIDAETFEIKFSSFIGLIMSLISAYLTASITLMYIKFMRGESISFHDLLAIDFNKFVHYILAVLISGVLMIFGFFLLIVPGFYLMARLMFVQYLVLDKDIGFMDAINLSFKMSNGHTLDLISFIFAMFFLLLLGFLSLFLGILIAIPVSSLASAQLYILFSTKN
tara:strand:- start:286 stop:912 length:627 start_codon:yes stop_codon:yes gene_type:complete